MKPMLLSFATFAVLSCSFVLAVSAQQCDMNAAIACSNEIEDRVSELDRAAWLIYKIIIIIICSLEMQPLLPRRKGLP